MRRYARRSPPRTSRIALARPPGTGPRRRRVRRRPAEELPQHFAAALEGAALGAYAFTGHDRRRNTVHEGALRLPHRASAGRSTRHERRRARHGPVEIVDLTGNWLSPVLGSVGACWDAIEVLIVTGATTAKVEAGNTGIKNIKRTGRGFRNAENYRTRILLTSAARTVA